MSKLFINTTGSNVQLFALVKTTNPKIKGIFENTMKCYTISKDQFEYLKKQTLSGKNISMSRVFSDLDLNYRKLLISDYWAIIILMRKLIVNKEFSTDQSELDKALKTSFINNRYGSLFNIDNLLYMI